MTPGGQLLDRFLLALCVWREARGETLKGKQLVADVVLNRANDSRMRWPRTIAGVVLQPLQFSSFNAGDPNAVKFPNNLTDLSSWEDCVGAADKAIAALPTVLTEANHYHAIGVNPSWADASKIVATEGAHVFYKL